MTPGQVKINGTADVYGTIFAHNVDIMEPAETVFTGTAKIFGASLTDTLVSKGTFDISYRKPSESIFDFIPKVFTDDETNIRGAYDWNVASWERF